MNEVFSYTTTAKIDAKLHRDVLAHEDKVEKIYIIAFFVLVLLFRGWIGYWLKFGVAIPSGYTAAKIDVLKDPVQTNYSPEVQKQKSFTYTSLINNHKIEIIPQAHYELSGSVVAFNHDFLFVSAFFDSAALYDLGAAWGDKLSDKRFYKKYFSSYSQKNEITGSRILWTEFKTYPAPVSIDYARSHWSHSHIVPANRNIMAAMLKLKEWDKVKIEGELVDMVYTPDRYRAPMEYRTSLSRTDTDDYNRGNGSCETVYVTSVQIGNIIYK